MNLVYRTVEIFKRNAKTLNERFEKSQALMRTTGTNTMMKGPDLESGSTIEILLEESSMKKPRGKRPTVPNNRTILDHIA